MASNDVLIMKENASGDFQVHTVTAQADKVLGFNSSLNPVMMNLGGGLTIYTQTGVEIDCNNGDVFICNTSSATMSFSNVQVGKMYLALLKATSAFVIITFPSASFSPVNTIGLSTPVSGDYRVPVWFMDAGFGIIIQIGEELRVL